MTERVATKGAGATVHQLFPQPSSLAPLELRLALRCENYSDVARAYGEAACRQGLAHVLRIVEELFGQGGFVSLDAADQLEAVLWDSTLLSEGPLNAACDHFVRWLCTAIAALPFDYDGRRINLSFAGSWKRADAAGGSSGNGSAASEDWARRYQADMDLASELLSRMVTDRLTLVWQRVAHASREGETLYHEGLLRAIGANGADELPGDALAAVERAGLVRSLDQFVVAKVLDELEAHPAAMLGVNISAHSAVLDSWWAEAERRLAGNPRIARRLIIEITETAALASISEVVGFVDRMRALGCRIALDDFGTGHASIRHLLALKPDIVKVDAFFLRHAAAVDPDRVALRHLIGLAGTIAPVVIVEGVESATDSTRAAEAGAVWQQGWFWGCPAVVRSRIADKQVPLRQARRGSAELGAL